MELEEKFSLEFDVHNEAWMHLALGRQLKPYSSSENAMERWIATTHSVGIRKKNGEIEVLAPFGLADIFEKRIRPIYHEDNSKYLYENKVKKWQERFSNLRIISWDELEKKNSPKS